MSFPTTFAPARDRTNAMNIAVRAGFVLLRPLRCDEREHSWHVRCQTTQVDAELVIGRQLPSFDRTAPQRRATRDGVSLAEDARRVGSSILGSQYDHIDSPQHGQLWLLEYRVCTPVRAWMAAAPLRMRAAGQAVAGSSAAGAALLLDLIRGAAKLRNSGMCMGRPHLDDFGVTAGGRLMLAANRGVHRVEFLRGERATSVDVLERPCCRLGVHPATVVDLANEVLSAGNRRDRLLEELTRIAELRGHEHRSEALELAIVDSVQPKRGRSPTVHELVARQSRWRSMDAEPSSHGALAFVARLGRNVLASSAVATTARRFGRRLGNRVVLRGICLVLGLGLLVAALLSAAFPASSGASGPTDTDGPDRRTVDLQARPSDV